MIVFHSSKNTLFFSFIDLIFGMYGSKQEHPTDKLLDGLHFLLVHDYLLFK